MINLKFAQEVGYGQYFYRTFLRQFYKRIIRQNHKIQLPNGNTMNLPINSRFASEICVTNCNVDWGSEQILIENLESDQVFLDVGANIGYYSLLTANHVNKVYAFEPDERNLKLLHRNIENINNIEIINQPVYSQVQEIQFDTGDCSEVSHIVVNPNTTKNFQSVKLTTTTLDNFADCNQGLSITGIKIDVEGADFDVLLGAGKLIERHSPLIIAEFFNLKHELFEYIDNFKYEVFAFTKPLLNIKNSLHKFKFIKVTKSNKDKYRYKMIFLVPPRLQSIFSNYTQN